MYIYNAQIQLLNRFKSNYPINPHLHLVVLARRWIAIGAAGKTASSSSWHQPSSAGVPACESSSWEGTRPGYSRVPALCYSCCLMKTARRASGEGREGADGLQARLMGWGRAEGSCWSLNLECQHLNHLERAFMESGCFGLYFVLKICSSFVLGLKSLFYCRYLQVCTGLDLSPNQWAYDGEGPSKKSFSGLTAIFYFLIRIFILTISFNHLANM